MRFILLFLVFSISAISVSAQQKKVYYDADFYVLPSAMDAQYYRLVNLDKNGKPLGITKDYYITGELLREGKLITMDPEDSNNDIYEGKVTDYHKNGKKMAEFSMVNGKFEGKYLFYYETGQINEELMYKNGKKDGPQIIYYQTGQVSAREGFKEDYLHGKYQVYYQNGKLKEEGEYLNGLLNGKVTAYDENGQILQIYSYKDDRYHGINQEFINGVLRKEQENYQGLPVYKWFKAFNASGTAYNAFEDNFYDLKNTLGWTLNKIASGESKINSDGLRISTVSSTKFASFIELPMGFSGSFAFKIGVNLTIPDAANHQGLIWNFTDWNNYSYFTISKGGEYRISTIKNGIDLHPVVMKAPAGTIVPNKVNYLVVNKVKPNAIEFYINNTRIDLSNFKDANGRPYTESDMLAGKGKWQGLFKYSGNTDAVFTYFFSNWEKNGIEAPRMQFFQ